MKRGTKSLLVAACAAGALLVAGAASASLNVFQTYTGTLGVTTDGLGAAANAGNITANVPVGATVVAAYLYSAVFFDLTAPTGTLAGQSVTYTQLGANGGFLQASRADVTSILAPLINGGPGGAYNFAVTEAGVDNVSGEALVLVYSDPTLAVSTIGILDGFSALAGDDSSISFASALHPGDPGFRAEMRVGIQHSCCDQASTISVNGQTLTTVAGNNDDSIDGISNSNLLTMGGDDDPLTIALPGFPQGDYNADHERYNLSPFITDGDTAIHIHTINPSNDDNIFLEVFQVTGEGVVHGNGVPEPATWGMMLLGFFGLGGMLRRRRAAIA